MKQRTKGFRTLLALALALAMVAGGLLPVLAEDYTKMIEVRNGNVYVSDNGHDWTFSKELTDKLKLEGSLDVDSTYIGTTGLRVEAQPYHPGDEEVPGEASFTVTGDVDTTGSVFVSAVVVSSEGGSSAEATVEGKVSVESKAQPGPIPFVTAAVVMTEDSDSEASLTVGKGIEGQVLVDAEDGATASLTVKDGGVKSEDPYGMYGPPAAVTATNQNGTANVDITGNIEVSGMTAVGVASMNMSGSPNAEELIIEDDDEEGGTAGTSETTITINGDINATGKESESHGQSDSVAACGAYMTGQGPDSSTTLTVNGNISAQADEYAYGLYLQTTDGAEITANVTGDTTTTSTGERGESADISAFNGGGTITATLTGNLIAKGEESVGIKVMSQTNKYFTADQYDDSHPYDGEVEPYYEGERIKIGDSWYELYSLDSDGERHYFVCIEQYDGEEYYDLYCPVSDVQEVSQTGATSITVQEGDVTSDNIGVAVSAEEGNTVDVIVDGTVEGGKGSLVLVNDTQLGDGVALTVWEVKANEDGALVSDMVNGVEGDDFDYKLVQNKEAEAELQYIIRVKADQKDIITAAGDAFDYRGYKVAHENDTVTLKLNIPDGYEVVEAYSDQAQSMKLEKNSKGEYFLTVPRGGAVELSVKLNKLPDPEPETDEPETVAITYILGNGTENDHIRTTAAIGEGVALHPAPERDGYTFLYWQSTDVNPGSPYYQEPDPDSDFQFRPGAIYTAKKDINFVAVWQKN